MFDIKSSKFRFFLLVITPILSQFLYLAYGSFNMTPLSIIICLIPVFLHYNKEGFELKFFLSKNRTTSLIRVFLIFCIIVMMQLGIETVNYQVVQLCNIPIKSAIGYGNIADFIRIVLVAPLLEEILFRGYFLQIYSNRPFAVLLSSFLFACIHFSLFKIVPSFLFGILACTLVYVTNSLIAPILMHMIVNYILISNFFISLKLSLPYLICICIIIFLASFILFPQIIKREKFKIEFNSIFKINFKLDKYDTISIVFVLMFFAFDFYAEINLI